MEVSRRTFFTRPSSLSSNSRLIRWIADRIFFVASRSILDGVFPPLHLVVGKAVVPVAITTP
jgi:hypothetical protein